MNQYKLLVLPGDGIGPEIIDEGLALLKQIEIIDNCSFDISKELVGGAAIDAYGEAIKDETIQIAKIDDKADVLFLSFAERYIDTEAII